MNGLLEDQQQTPGWQVSVHPRHEVQEQPADVSYRLRLVRGRVPNQLTLREHAQQPERAGAEVAPIALVRPDPDVGFNHPRPAL